MGYNIGLWVVIKLLVYPRTSVSETRGTFLKNFLAFCNQGTRIGFMVPARARRRGRSRRDSPTDMLGEISASRTPREKSSVIFRRNGAAKPRD